MASLGHDKEHLLEPKTAAFRDTCLMCGHLIALDLPLPQAAICPRCDTWQAIISSEDLKQQVLAKHYKDFNTNALFCAACLACVVFFGVLNEKSWHVYAELALIVLMFALISSLLWPQRFKILIRTRALMARLKRAGEPALIPSLARRGEIMMEEEIEVGIIKFPITMHNGSPRLALAHDPGTSQSTESSASSSLPDTVGTFERHEKCPYCHSAVTMSFSPGKAPPSYQCPYCACLCVVLEAVPQRLALLKELKSFKKRTGWALALMVALLLITSMAFRQFTDISIWFGIPASLAYFMFNALMLYRIKEEKRLKQVRARIARQDLLFPARHHKNTLKLDAGGVATIKLSRDVFDSDRFSGSLSLQEQPRAQRGELTSGLDLEAGAGIEDEAEK